MTKHLQRLITGSVIAFVLQSHPVMGQVGSVEIKEPKTPTEIKVPAGNTPFLKAYASGTQNYICMPTETAFMWKFLGPQATLFVRLQWMDREIFQQVTTHFLSANPVESGTLRPTWQHSFDTSAVWGMAIASSNDPKYVEPGAIAWLLVRAMGSQVGPTGGSTLAQTTFIQRVNTSGGVAPSTGCSQYSNIGATAFVPYTTDYYFYKAVNN